MSGRLLLLDDSKIADKAFASLLIIRSILEALGVLFCADTSMHDDIAHGPLHSPCMIQLIKFEILNHVCIERLKCSMCRICAIFALLAFWHGQSMDSRKYLLRVWLSSGVCVCPRGL